MAVCCGLNDETYQLFDADAFAAMKPSAGIVTIARGGCIDTDALVDALKEGEISFAGLDVTDPEPLPAGHPLWAMNNVVITPHSSGESTFSVFHSHALLTIDGWHVVIVQNSCTCYRTLAKQWSPNVRVAV